jgi:hypothetical protein
MAARTLTLYTLLLAIVLALGACKKDDYANEAMEELSALTDDIVKKVKDAEDKKAGVAEAQKALDAKKEALTAKMNEISRLTNLELGTQAQGNIARVLVDVIAEMAQMENDLLIATMRDKELETAVEKLTADHDAIIEVFTRR